MKDFSSENYTSVVSVRHQGIVITFGSRLVTDPSTAVVSQVVDYRVLDIQNYDPAVPIDENKWGEVKTLEFPDQYRPLGMSLLTIPTDSALTVQNTNFQVFSDTKYIFFFRQSSQNTLYVTRFVLDSVNLELNPAWETRYQRSEQKDISTNQKDTLGFKNMDSDSFDEPTMELTMVRNLSDGQFTVALTPSEIPGQEMWQIFAFNNTTKKIDLFSIPYSEDGLFDLSKKTIDPTSGLIKPDRSFTLELQQSTGDPLSLPIKRCSSSLMYTKQEEVIDESGKPQKLRRSMRLMLAFVVSYYSAKQVAIIDLGIGKDGSLTKFGDTIKIQTISKPVKPNVASMPTTITDDNGLTLTCGLLSFVNTTDAVTLLEGADGLVHLYFVSSLKQNAKNFQVAQYSTETARAQFSVDTSAGVKVDFIGRYTGTMMNGASVIVEAGSDNNLAKVNLAYTPPNSQQITEVWEGVPRKLDSFLKVFSSQATDDIYNPLVKTGQKLFYNYNNTWKMYGVATENSYLRFVSQLPASLIEESVTSIAITDGGNVDSCNLTINMQTAGQMMTEVWQNLPRQAEDLWKILNGKSTGYDYTQASCTYPVYKVAVGGGNIWFISKNAQINNAAITITVIDLNECKLTLTVNIGGTTTTETWENMARDPQKFIQALQGNDPDYDYSKAVSTDSQVDLRQGTALFKVVGANPTKQITSQLISYAPTLQGGSALFVAVSEKVSGKVTNSVEAINQKVIAANQQVYEYRTSALFSLGLSKLVDDLGDINVQNTPEAGAPRTKDGLDCAWTPIDPGTALDFEGSCVQCPTGKLDLTGDFTMEAWVKPEIIGYDGFSRIFHYNSDKSQYVLGLKASSEANKYTIFAGTRKNLVYANALALDYDKWTHLAAAYKTGHSLLLDGNDYIYCENSSSLNPAETMTIEAWVKIPDTSEQDKIIISKYGVENKEQSYQLKVSGEKVIFNLRTNQPNSEVYSYELITIEHEFTPSDNWTYLAVTVGREIIVDTEQGISQTKFTLKLYINGSKVGDDVTQTFNGTLQINNSTTFMSMGGIPTDAQIPPEPLATPFEFCEARLWNKVLSDTDIWNNCVAMSLSISEEGLVSYWALNEGEGKSANDMQNVNNGIISSTKLWKFTTLGGEWALYVDGERVGTLFANINDYNGYGTEKVFYIGAMGYGWKYQSPVNGILDELRIWNTTRTEEQIRDNMNCVMVGSEPDLRACWDFNAGSGNELKDITGFGNDGIFVQNDITVKIMSLKTDNNQTLALALGFDGDVDITQFGFDFNNGWMLINCQVGAQGSLSTKMNPNIGINVTQTSGSKTETTKLMDSESLQLWSNQAIELKIMPGDGSKFQQLQGDSGWVKLAVPTWVNTPAPVGNEGPQVFNCLGGLSNEYNVDIEGQPAVVEYGDMQVDSEGNLFGVMKRSYAYITGEKIKLVTGFKVGDMDLIYIGQVQTSPKLIGYIEGAPPVPSENLTLNDPKTDDYVGNTSVELIEEDSTLYNYSTSRETGFDMSIDFKVGALFGIKFAAGGIGFMKDVQGTEQKLGLHSVFEHSLGWVNESSVGAGSVSTITKKMDMCGFWEEKKDYDQNGTPRYLNQEVGQRYIPNNMGYALVKSNTADMYALKLRTNGSLVAYQLSPNPNIPQDWNIIMFPLNPSYIKNGTLDGMVGLVTDPDYPNAVKGIRGSYFQPVEAYALKNQIDQEQEEIKTYFSQSNAGSKGRGDDTTLPTGELLRDWTNKISKRSMVNTYVWTAQGGLYAEEEQFTDIKTEATGGSYYFLGKAGIYTDLKFHIFGFGAFFELDSLFGGHIKTSVVSGAEYNDTFGLKVNVTGEGWLNKWDPETKQYLSYDCPGKVDTYRFMTFYLAPKTDNFEVFFDKVVDDNWLQNSTAPNALALREVQTEENPVWRVLYRTTYVSRVPPQFERTPLDSGPDPVKKPINISANSWLIDLVQDELGTTNPSPAEIGKAVDTVFDVKLKTFNEWWSDFWIKAQNPDSPEYKILENMRYYTKTYLNNYYLTLD